MHGLGLCIKLSSFVSYMFYAGSLSNNKSVLIAINQNKYDISLNTYTTVFDWGADNSNKNRTQLYNSFIRQE